MQPAPLQEVFPADFVRESQLDFAVLALRNSQELIRFIDQKAGLTITGVGILTTAFGSLLIRALSTPTNELWQLAARVVLSVTVLVYLVLAFRVIGTAIKVLVPGTPPLRRDSTAPGLLYPLMLLERYADDEDAYYERLADLQPRDMLKDYANQMVEVANVYRAKQRHLHTTLRRFRWLCGLWLATVLELALIVILTV